MARDQAADASTFRVVEESLALSATATHLVSCYEVLCDDVIAPHMTSGILPKYSSGLRDTLHGCCIGMNIFHQPPHLDRDVDFFSNSTYIPPGVVVGALPYEITPTASFPPYSTTRWRFAGVFVLDGGLDASHPA